VAALLLALVVTTPAAAAKRPRSYVVTLLASSNGDVFAPAVQGNPINAAGLVAGSTRGETPHAAVYDTRRNTVRELDGLPPDCWSHAVDVNALGHVAGYSYCTPRFVRRGFLWTAPGVPVTWFSDREDLTLEPVAMNDHDVVTGTYYDHADESSDAFVWHPQPAALERIGTLGGNYNYPSDINNGGYITGMSETKERQYRPYLWLPRTKVLSRIGTPTNWNYGRGTSINDRGYVVGDYALNASPGISSPFVWSPLTHHLETLPNAGDNTHPTAISSRGVVVGYRGYFDTKALVWDTCGGAPKELPPVAGAPWTAPIAVNATGRIVASVVYGDPFTHPLDRRGVRFDRHRRHHRPPAALPCRS